ncbi:MAG TPA: hypothetical protein DEF05_10830 [Erwinia sp.]|nr:hypothetical protein [Erwinia sp.]
MQRLVSTNESGRLGMQRLVSTSESGRLDMQRLEAQKSQAGCTARQKQAGQGAIPGLFSG